MGAIGAIVLAAGSGDRFGGEKQFLELEPGTRLVDRSIAAVSGVERTVVVVPSGHRWVGPDHVLAVTGGADRISSVRAGLAELGEVEVVIVHDAAHPLATRALVWALVGAVRDGADAAVPLWDVPDVVKRRSAQGLSTVGREGLGLTQVPMAFRADTLRRVHRDALDGGWSAVEDSALVERAGGVVTSVPGEVTNVHIVDQSSLALARHLVTHVDQAS